MTRACMRMPTTQIQLLASNLGGSWPSWDSRDALDPKSAATGASPPRSKAENLFLGPKTAGETSCPIPQFGSSFSLHFFRIPFS